jgi:hypothetical protein
MRDSAGQKITTLLVPVFLLAALAGTLVGGATGGLMIALPYLGENDQAGLEAWGGLASYTMTGALFGAAAGCIYGLLVAAGAVVGLAIQAAKRHMIAANHQALAPALGAAAASLVLAGATVALNEDATGTSFGVAAAFVLATFLFAFFIGRLYLGRLETRDQAAISVTGDDHSELLAERYGKH